MADSTHSSLRIGIVGAGENTRKRHIPGLLAIPGVQLVGVVNRSASSTARVAAEFGIPRQFPDWQSLVSDPSLDAVVVGTWPNLHCEVSCAALAAGKHVLCEARMARDLAEAKMMQAAAIAQPNCVAMLVPSPFGLQCDAEIQKLQNDCFIGELRELVVLGADDQFHDYSKVLHWRQDRSISGVNVLTLGILHETAIRWVPRPTRVFAQTQTFEPVRPNPSGAGNVAVTVPDSVQILTQMPDGARGIYHLSGINLHGPGKQIHLYGSSGTIKIMFGPREQVFIGRVGDTSMRELIIPPEMQGEWRVEAEFIGAIRGEEPVRRTDFASGLHYMEFTEAVARSAELGLPVDLPLK